MKTKTMMMMMVVEMGGMMPRQLRKKRVGYAAAVTDALPKVNSCIP